MTSTEMDNAGEGEGSGRIPDSAYDSWDPMGDVSKHFLELVNYDFNDPLGAMHGAEKLKPEELPCKFYKYDSTLETCGRRGCQYRHVKTKHAEPLVLREITLSNEIEQKRNAPIGMINVGIVVSAWDPGDFVIVPYSGWTCGCKLSHIGEEKEETYGWGVGGSGIYGQSNDTVPNSGIANLVRLFEDFQQFDRVQLLEKKLSSVTANQVVAVELQSQGKKNRREWYRAVVVEDAILGEDSEVTLRLLDYGTLTTAEFRHLALLPSKLLRYPPLGYRCALNGVSPITHRWSRRAREVFVDMVHGRHCVFELTRSSNSEDGIFETEPNLVELSIQIGDQYVNLSEKLISEGLGLEWNAFPTEPGILRCVSNPRGVGLLMSQRAALCSELNPSPVTTETIENQKLVLEQALLKWSAGRQQVKSLPKGGCTTHLANATSLLPLPSHSVPAGAWRNRLPSQPTGLGSRRAMFKPVEQFPRFHGPTAYSNQTQHFQNTVTSESNINCTTGSGGGESMTQPKRKTKWKPLKL